VLTVDGEGSVQYANAAAARLFALPAGLTRGTAGPAWLHRLGPAERELLRDRVRKVYDGALPSWEGTVTITGEGGASHWLRVEAHPLLDPVEEERYVEIVGSDVTELLLARRAAEQRQDRLALLSNVAQTVSGEREEERILRRFLDRLREWLPVTSVCLYRPTPDGATLVAADTAGDGSAPWPGRIAQGEHPAWAALRDTLPASGGPAPGGGENVQVLYLPLFAAGTTVGVLGAESPVRLSPGPEETDLLTQLGILLGGALYLATLIRELEEQRGIALQASRMKSEFLANTSHELRTPLTSILGFLRLLLDGTVRDPAKQQEFLRIAHESAERLLAIINDVLDLAKIEAGRLEVSPGAVTAQEVLNDVQRLFVHQMRNKAVRFTVHPAPAGTVVLADPQRLRQILTNLLSNALKFTPRSGHIEVTVTREDSTAVFEVRDTGPGIPREELDRVFESFYQVDGSTTRSAGGTGLGLTISRRLARMMAGDLTLDSTPGQGTVARLTLPLAQQD
jgi:signal transduction histidine kinase